MSDLFEFLDKEYMDDYVSRRIKRKVNLWVIRSKTKDVNNYWETDPSALRELRHAPTRLIFSMTQYVFDDRVALISSRQEGFGMVIQSKEFAANQRNLFESLWKVSKPESDKRR